MKVLLPRGLRAGAVSLAAAAACALTASADDLVVVHDAGGTVPAAPHVERPRVSDEAKERALDRARARLADRPPVEAPGFLPVNPAPLRAGRPSRTRIRGLLRPVFAVGSDPASLEWLASNAARLRRGGAQGFLVAARAEDDLGRARAFAARLGLRLDPLPGAALADAYGAGSYPFVAEPSP